MSTVRLVHLSDLHLAVRPLAIDPLSLLRTFQDSNVEMPANWCLAWLSSYHPGALLAAARYVAGIPDVDAVIVTGDLATSGRPADLTLARTFLLGPPLQGYLALHPFAGATDVPAPDSLFPTISTRRALWIPGNHDRYVGTGAIPYWPGGQEFERVVGWPGGGSNTSRITGPHNVGGNGSVVISGMDCTLANVGEQQGFGGFLAEGIVRDADLLALEAVTSRSSPEQCLIWLVHWPPEWTPPRRLHGLANEAALLTRAREKGVNLIMSGHTHEAKIYRSSVGVPVLCCGTSSQTIGQRSHTLFDITITIGGGAPTVGVDQLRYNAETAEFEIQTTWSV